MNKGYVLGWHCLRRRRQRNEANVKRNAPLKHALLVRWKGAQRAPRRWFFAALFGVSRWWEFSDFPLRTDPDREALRRRAREIEQRWGRR